MKVGKNIPERASTWYKSPKGENAWQVGEQRGEPQCLRSGNHGKVPGLYCQCSEEPLESFRQGGGLTQSLFSERVLAVWEKGQ